MKTIVHDLQARIDATIPPLVGNTTPRRIVVLDAPDYPNVGDPAIFLGEMAFLRRAYPKATITAISHRTYAPAVDHDVEQADLLFLQGGGNFGDSWPLHHDFRTHIIDRFAEKTIIQFPQSFHFSQEATLAETRRVIRKAKKLILLARDHKGQAFAEANFECTVALCPDMAFAMGPLEALPATLDFACLLRTDKELLEEKSAEVRKILQDANVSFAVDDWIENRTGIEKVHGLARLMIRRGLSPAIVARHGLSVFELYARSRLKFGISLLARGRTVITDRLHGHILATLIGRPRILFDSLDGKVRAFNETWMAEDRQVVFLDRVADLRQQIPEARAAA